MCHKTKPNQTERLNFYQNDVNDLKRLNMPQKKTTNQPTRLMRYYTGRKVVRRHVSY